MTASADDSKRAEFAHLKYEQMLSGKYFIKVCQSKAYESNPPEEMIRNLRMEIANQ